MEPRRAPENIRPLLRAVTVTSFGGRAARPASPATQHAAAEEWARALNIAYTPSIVQTLAQGIAKALGVGG